MQWKHKSTFIFYRKGIKSAIVFCICFSLNSLHMHSCACSSKFLLLLRKWFSLIKISVNCNKLINIIEYFDKLYLLLKNCYLEFSRIKFIICHISFSNLKLWKFQNKGKNAKSVSRHFDINTITQITRVVNNANKTARFKMSCRIRSLGESFGECERFDN